MIGCLVPLVVWLVAIRWRWSFLLRFFAGFCLVANGAYIDFMEETGAEPPLYWEREGDGWVDTARGRRAPIDPAQPVYITQTGGAPVTSVTLSDATN